MMSRHWLPLIAMMPASDQEETMSSIHHGINLMAETRHYPKYKDTFFRNKNKRMVSIPVHDRAYHDRYLSNFAEKREDHTVTRLKHKKGQVIETKQHESKVATKPIGYRPMLVNQYNTCDSTNTMGFFKTSEKWDDCQLVIAAQFRKWIASGAVHFIGRLSELKQQPQLDKVHTILPISVEKSKPRICTDGGPCKGISPDKIECKLTCIQEVIAASEEGTRYAITDDSNGFQNSLLNPWSARMMGLVFGDCVFTHNALPFGTTQSPGRYQQCNGAAINALALNGFCAFWYIDDRIELTLNTKFKIPAGHTSLGCALLAILLTMLGGWVNTAKSFFSPSTFVKFLGFELDSVEMSVSVPQDKYDKAICLMSDMWENDNLNIKKLEKLRGKVVSWQVVVPILKLFIREMTDIIRQAVLNDEWFWPRSKVKTNLD